MLRLSVSFYLLFLTNVLTNFKKVVYSVNSFGDWWQMQNFQLFLAIKFCTLGETKILWEKW